MLIVVLILTGGVLASGFDLGVGKRQTTQTEISLDEFLRRSPEARTAMFRSLNAAGKAHIKRAHAERWLAANRSRLSGKAIAATEAAIAFVTPDIYTRTTDPDLRKREGEVIRQLVCAVGLEKAKEAFLLDRPPAQSAPSWRSTIDAWLSWFSDCVVSRIGSDRPTEFAISARGL
jgi:hypothetical protein